MKEIYRTHPDHVGEIAGVLSSNGFHPRKIPTFGESNAGTIVDSAIVVLGVPDEELDGAKEVLRSYLAQRRRSISGDSRVLKRSLLGGAAIGSVAALVSWLVKGLEFSETAGISALNWFLLGWLLGTLGIAWADELRTRKRNQSQAGVNHQKSNR